ncbi:OmpA family protein [uncultured Maribacter sp.]|uniref:OmpA family protein n=1 Tax=uncultured Maribacter sp. TaxID=431308 RepID=UPI002627A81B|nr:OmpA family protein [uncultured Maribacter sp.]
MKKIIYTFLGLATMTAVVNAQEKKINKANQNYKDYAYAPAIDSYEKLIKDGYSKEEIFKNLGNANYVNANYQEATKWYEQLFQLENTSIDPEFMYRYAQSLKSLEKYNESDQWMQKFKDANTQDQRAIKFGDNLEYLDNIEANSNRYDIKNLAINSNESDFAPSITNEMLVFSTARDSGITSRKINEWNNKAFLNLYKANPNESGEYVVSSKLSKELNKKTHESSTAFTKDGTTVYFTRNNSVDGKFARDENGVSRLKIYKATLAEGEWINIIELPFNGDNYSVAHPTLNKDETKLYFASDMPGTLGESDIFSVDINTDGSYGTPVNLGKTINTESRETFPFITQDNKLYFASDGHPGLGGLDVFVTNLENSYRPTIENVGRPINSEEDDFSFIINEETKKGFFASNRDGGQGDDDIYSFIENKALDLNCYTKIAGVIKDLKTGALLDNAEVKIYNSLNEVITKGITGNDGAFSLDGDCAKGDYKLVATKEDYNQGDKMFATVAAKDITDVELSLEKTRRAALIGTDLAKYLDIVPIYFDFDKSFIREDAKVSMEKVLAYLREFPEVHVQVRSHTDSRANDWYNEGLSVRRAKSTAAYLISQGIAKERISHKGFGETELTNECSNEVICSKEKHQANRRSEFIIVK